MKGEVIFVSIAKILLLLALCVLLGINILQNENIEKRLIEFSGKIDRLSDTLSSGQPFATDLGTGAPRTPGKSEPKRKWLHPEVKNFLVEEKDFTYTPPDARMDGKLTRYFGSDPKGLNFLLENGADVSEFVQRYVAEYPAERQWNNPDLYRPRLAERVEVTDDFKEYTIYLRPGVKWHKPAVDWSNPRYDWLKGDHYITAHDFKFTIDTILNPQTECAFLRNYYQDVDYCKVIDDYTFVVRWKKKTHNSIAFTLELIPMPEFLYAYDEEGKRFPKETFGLKFNEHWYNKKAIGCGPYEFVSFETGVSLKLRRFEDYYGEKPAIKEITFLIYGDMSQNVLKLRSGELDACGLTPTQYREEVLNARADSPFKNGQIHNQTYPRSSYYFIGWNADRPLFADKRVRRAMTYAFNREGILRNVFLGLGTVVSGPFYVSGPDYDHNIKPLPFDLKEAIRLLKEAGWEDVDGDGILEKKIGSKIQKFEFNLLSYGQSPEWKAAGAIFKEDLIKIGVKMNIQMVDWAVLQKKMDDKEFDAYTGGWTLPWDPDPYQVWHSSQADVPKGSNRVGFRNKEADKIIEEARATFDPEKRHRLFHRFHAIIYEEQPYSFFFAPRSVYAWQDRVKRVIFRKIKPHTDSRPWWVDLRPEKQAHLSER